ncbi:hypothetical protein [Streptomyces sp. NPDC020965]|uniref:hypothetical protein n=1 Tax=Streptomyces sp. NPDC020965 TaxID=3365105 RepID=UPI0037B602AC
MVRREADPQTARSDMSQGSTGRELPEVGTLVHDIVADKVGEFRGAVGGRWQLRPCGGGVEWEVEPGAVARPGTAEQVRALVAEDNARRKAHRR